MLGTMESVKGDLGLVDFPGSPLAINRALPCWSHISPCLDGNVKTLHWAGSFPWNSVNTTCSWMSPFPSSRPFSVFSPSLQALLADTLGCPINALSLCCLSRTVLGLWPEVTSIFPAPSCGLGTVLWPISTSACPHFLKRLSSAIPPQACFFFCDVCFYFCFHDVLRSKLHLHLTLLKSPSWLV